MPSSSPTSCTCARCACISSQISCMVSSGAPESSNWPPGSRMIVAAAVRLDRRDDVVVLQDRRPAEARAAGLRATPDRALAVIGHRRERIGEKRKFLVLGADAPGIALARALLQIGDELGRAADGAPRASSVSGEGPLMSSCFSHDLTRHAVAASRQLRQGKVSPHSRAPVAERRLHQGERRHRRRVGPHDARPRAPIAWALPCRRSASRSPSEKPPSGPMRIASGPRFRPASTPSGSWPGRFRRRIPAGDRPPRRRAAPPAGPARGTSGTATMSALFGRLDGIGLMRSILTRSAWVCAVITGRSLATHLGRLLREIVEPGVLEGREQIVDVGQQLRQSDLLLRPQHEARRPRAASRRATRRWSR